MTRADARVSYEDCIVVQASLIGPALRLLHLGVPTNDPLIMELLASAGIMESHSWMCRTR